MSKSQETGILGEQIAKTHIIKSGYTVLKTNYRCRYGEIDIIATKNTTLEFFEVRTRTQNSLNLPEESITRLKFLHIQRTVAHFFEAKLETLNQNPPLEITSWRISLIGILLDSRGNLIRLSYIPIK
jgi:putative endonuclease